MNKFLHKHYLSSAAALLLLAAAVLSSCSVEINPGVSKTGFAMGSAISAKVYCGDETEANGITQEIFTAISALDAKISATDPSSEIGSLNADGQMVLSDETVTLIKNSLDMCALSGGRLDISLGAVTELWGFSTDEPRVPDEIELREALATAGTENIIIDGNTVTLLNGAKIDLGATGKGAGCDEAARVLEKYGYPAVISFGGTVLLYGDKPNSGAWSVGVRDPYGEKSDYCATLELSPGSGSLFISTSGSYEKKFTEDGVTYHHIIDPSTGYPVETGLASVTAVSKSGYISDALSTALFSMGLNDASLGIVDEYLTGALFFYADGRVYVSEGLRSGFDLINTDYYSLISDDEIS